MYLFIQDENDIDGTEQHDLLKIETLHWLLYDPSQLDEALERANLLIRYYIIFFSSNRHVQFQIQRVSQFFFLYFLRKFKATGKDELALSAFEKIPSNAPDSLNKVFESLSNRQNLILKEYLSWSAYFSGTIHSSLYSPFFFVLPLYLVQTPFTIWQSLIKFFDIEQVNTLPKSDFTKFSTLGGGPQARDTLWANLIDHNFQKS